MSRWLPAVGSEIYGLTLPELPEGTMPLRALMLVEVLMPDGKRMLLNLSTQDIQVWEVAGMAVWLDQSVRNQLGGGPPRYDGGSPGG